VDVVFAGVEAGVAAEDDLATPFEVFDHERPLGAVAGVDPAAVFFKVAEGRESPFVFVKPAAENALPVLGGAGA